MIRGMALSTKTRKNDEEERRMLPFFVEFVKFSTTFAALIAVALITLRFASAT